MLTLQEAKEFLRVDGDEEDALISSLILTAKDLTEDLQILTNSRRLFGKRC